MHSVYVILIFLLIYVVFTAYNLNGGRHAPASVQLNAFDDKLNSVLTKLESIELVNETILECVDKLSKDVQTIESKHAFSNKRINNRLEEVMKYITPEAKSYERISALMHGKRQPVSCALMQKKAVGCEEITSLDVENLLAKFKN